MIIKTKKIKNNRLDSNSIIKKHLSIQFSLDGFSFCICDLQYKKEVLAYSKYLFDHQINTPEKLLRAIKQIFLKDPELQHSFDSVMALHDNKLITFVPNIFFDKENLNSYLQYNNKLLATDFYMYDTIKNQDMKAVYLPYVNVNNFLIDKFGSFDYRHASSILVENLVEDFASKDKRIFIDLSDSFFKICVTQNRKLLLFNTFTYNSKEDFIYYVLFTAEQLEIDLKETSLFLLGEVIKKKALLIEMEKYVNSVKRIEPKQLVSDAKIEKQLAVEEYELFHSKI